MGFLSRGAQNMAQEFSQESLQKQNSETRRVQEYSGNGTPSVGLEVERSVEQVLSKARPTFLVDLIQKGDELTEEDLEIIEAVQQGIEEEQEQLVEEEEVDNFLCSFSKCYIDNCEVHTLLPKCIHYGDRDGYDMCKISAMNPRLKKGYECYKKHMGCSHVEVYERHICIVDYNGITTVINE